MHAFAAPNGARAGRNQIMPKMKTHKGAAKRFSRTGTGKLKRGVSGRRHLLNCKSTKRKRNMRSGGQVHASDMKRFDHVIP
jgi:large subunit ribosomal protein L35